MFDQYQQVPNDKFMENPLIKFLADDQRWTVSDKKKRPVDARYLLDTHEVRNARVLDDPYPLVTLHKLNQDANLEMVNRTYRLQAQQNQVIMIDVEPEASDELLEYAVNFPAHLTEISRNGGVHLLIALPDKAITPENEYLLKSTVINSDNNDFEVICNDHFITFTKRLVLDKPVADYHNNQDHFNQLMSFLDNIVKMDAEKQKKREQMKEIAVEFDETNVHTEDIKTLLDSTSFIDFMEKQKKKKPEDFNNDLSAYEASVSTACAGHVYRFVQYLSETQALQYKFAHLTENDWIYASYLMAKFILPGRDKHGEYRNNLPWLLYTAQNGWSYIRAMNE